MASLLQGDPSASIEPLAGKVDLIYIDPPFDTGADFRFRVEVGGEEIEKEPSILEQLAYRDTWRRGTDSYLQVFYEWVVLMADLLSSTGSIYVHVDSRLDYLVRFILDDVFGSNCYRNTIIWKRDVAGKGAKRVSHQWPRNADTIFFYSKSPDSWHFEQQYQELTQEQERAYRYVGPNGRKYKAVQLGDYSARSIQIMEEQGLIHVSDSGQKYKKYYLDEAKSTVDCIWSDILGFGTRTASSEITGFPTQKPAELLERILCASSKPGDLVADFFLGSGTTAAVAHKLGRRWIGVDLGRFAIHTSRKRLLDLGATFDVLNLGKYERSHWQGVTLGDQLRAYVDFILSLYHAEPVPGFKHLHGVKAGRAVHIGAVDAPVTFDELDDVLAECRATSTHAVDILGWEWEMGVNQQAQQRAETFGVDLRLHQIPNDVMDRRAKAADVKFYSLAYIEASIRHVQARTVQVELTDFIIPDLDLIPEAVRDKVKRWSDYIDYWAVDFDYRRDTLAQSLPSNAVKGEANVPALSEANVFRNGWQAFRTRARRTLDTTSATHTYDAPGAYTIAIKVVDVFGIDSTKCLEVTA